MPSPVPHQRSRNPDGSYGIAPGWGPATNIVFCGNRYVGQHEDRPADIAINDAAAPAPMVFKDWPGPQFDPRQPGKFGAYIKAHRAWMLRLMGLYVSAEFPRLPWEIRRLHKG